MQGEEFVESFVEQTKVRGHSAWWEVNGTRDNVFVPHFVFTMRTGSSTHGPVQSSLSDGAALGRWGAVTSSIRVRRARPAATQTAPMPGAS